jgi:valyl-tRNA synthetase
MPFITEELYQKYFNKYEKKKSIHIAEWPKADEKLIDEEIEKKGDLAVQIISDCRKFKSEKNISLKVEIKELTIICSEKTKSLLDSVLDDIKNTVNAVKINFNLNEEEGIELKIVL